MADGTASWRAVLSRLDDAAALIDLDPDLHRILRQPVPVLEVAIPVRMDSGAVEVFTGWRRAPQRRPRSGQGRHPLPSGGRRARGHRARGGDDVQDGRARSALRRRQGRRALRSVTLLPQRARARHPPLHVGDPAPPRTRHRRAGARREHRRARHGLDDGHRVDGERTHAHGGGDRASRSRCRAARDTRARPPAGSSPASASRSPSSVSRWPVRARSCRASARSAARSRSCMHSVGMRVVGISDVSGAITNPAGIDVPALADHVRATGFVTGFPAPTPSTPPTCSRSTARSSSRPRSPTSSTPSNAPRITARLIVEGANGPTAPEADADARRATASSSIPDILANGGGVTASYFEWAQNRQGYAWDDNVLAERLPLPHGEGVPTRCGPAPRSSTCPTGVPPWRSALDRMSAAWKRPRPLPVRERAVLRQCHTPSA